MTPVERMVEEAARGIAKRSWADGCRDADDEGFVICGKRGSSPCLCRSEARAALESLGIPLETLAALKERDFAQLVRNANYWAGWFGFVGDPPAVGQLEALLRAAMTDIPEGPAHE